MNVRRMILSLVVLLAVSVPLVAQGTYKQIDYPGALQTLIYGINTGGDLVGAYEDTNFQWRGFLLSGGVFTAIEYPLESDTYAYGINDVGQIVGQTGLRGFIYDIGTKAFTILSFPNNENGATTAVGINNGGTIVGYFFHQSLVTGFQLSAGTYKVILPGPVHNSVTTGINNLNDVVGYGFNNTGPIMNFIFNPGMTKRVKIRADEISGINDAGTVVGTYRGPGGIAVGFVLPKGGTAEKIIFPGAGVSDTGPFAINNNGVVAGWFVDSGGAKDHGFIWTPDAKPEGE